jgi:hypothetical protein
MQMHGQNMGQPMGQPIVQPIVQQIPYQPMVIQAIPVLIPGMIPLGGHMMENCGVPYIPQNYPIPPFEKANDLPRKNGKSEENNSYYHDNINVNYDIIQNEDEKEHQNPQEVKDLHYNRKDHQFPLKLKEEFRDLNKWESSYSGKEDSLSREIVDYQFTPGQKLFKIERERKAIPHGMC